MTRLSGSTRYARVNGVQLHPTSLPGGRLGDEAFAFVDWLAEAGQSWWQTLPLGPTGEGGSPYKSPSAFAGAAELLADPGAPVSAAEIEALREREAYWLPDWEAFAGPGAVADQVRFDREWTALREYAAERGVGIIGDLPIYVAAEGADHRAHPELFQTGAQAGAPPDKFTDLGQLWGNPLYDWPALRRRRYRWWVERLRRTSRLVDLSRIDHFRGFVAYWSVPEGAADASGGHWARGPGRALFEAIRAELGDLPLVAENLGEITPPVERLRHELNLPGMAVMQFAFDPDEPKSPYKLPRHEENDVVYTGTHDHDTARGWYESLKPTERDDFEREVTETGIDDDPWWSLIRLTMTSRCHLCMLQMQDVLGLGSEARMNTPGTVGPQNWSWRMQKDALTPELAQRLRTATAAANRLPARSS
ncbi:MAG: 4-alpha-glucanotransferase [Actinobacteria bacterium]|nr:4-alpha-glucanotransferase [Actinomycetota bacterium]